MRRKSERTSTKKTKASPEKKVEKLKRTRRGRRKQSNSSDNESADESNPVQEMETVSKPESKPQSPAKEDSPEDAADQVWRVKAAEGSDDVGEIKKLKICLTRPPSTPERVDRSPRSKRKHSRATSSSDTTSVEGVDEKKKSKHRSKKQSKDKDEKGHDSHGEEIEGEPEQQESDKSSNEVSQSDTTTNECEKKETETAEVPMSTTDEDTKTNEGTSDANEGTEQPEQSVETDEQQSQKTSDADTTVVSPKDETRVVSPSGDNPNTSEKTPERKRSLSVDKSEILELHPEDSKCESDNETVKPKEDVKDEPTAPEETTSREKQVSTIEEAVNKDSQSGSNKIKETDVVETSKTEDREERKTSVDSAAANVTNNVKEKEVKEHETHPKTIERSDSTQSVQDPVSNGPPAASVVSRKRRWGSRSNKLTTQKSITISTDVLKEIIPDVKPTEFEEVIEEKKHKRIEIPEKERVERPLLPKIVIDNSENIEKRHEVEEKDTAKAKESHLSSNRKISIVKENESIIARPPSPPRHKQSNILYITNLVRPFTLQQLKNLLQRTGRIVDDGFWMDKIKSKCFVKYKSEEQAVETRHALHGVRWPVSNPKTLQVDFSTEEAFDKAKSNEDADNAQVSTMPGTVEDWLWEQDMKRERGELDKPWERKASTREWDLGKNEKDKDKDKMRREEPRPIERRRQRSIEKSPEPARKFKKKEEEAPAKLLDDLFRKTKATPCIYWLPLSAETIAVKEEQRRQHMAEHERRLLELRRPHRRH